MEAFTLLSDIAPSHFQTSPDPNAMVVIRAEVYPVEAIVRGVLTGSAWRAYEASGEVCGIKLPKGMKKNQMLDKPIFTPTTKARTGHDENITFKQMVEMLGPVAHEIKDLSLEAYARGLDKAMFNDGILVDTKFEWGYVPAGQHRLEPTMLVDEALTHDSSRFVGMDEYEQAFEEGRDPHWLDKQIIRDFAEAQSFKGDEGQLPPHLPDEIILADINALGGAFRFLTGRDLGEPDEPPTNERIERNLRKAGII